MLLEGIALRIAGSALRPSFSETAVLPNISQLTFAYNAFERLTDTFYPVLILTVMDRQRFGDDVCASGDVSIRGRVQKNGLANVKFVDRHGAPRSTQQGPTSYAANR